jgi:hypothetical protein
MRSKLFVIAVAFGSIAALSSTAQAQIGTLQGQGNRQGRLANRPLPKRNYLPELRAVVDSLAKRTESKILVDPSLFVAAAPKPPAEDASLDKALDQLVLAVKGSSWKKVYLQQNNNTLTPSPDKLANSVRTLDQLEHSGLVLENPVTKKATTYLKNYAVSNSFVEDLQAGQFNTTPVYILYATTVSLESKSVEERFADLQRQQMEMMMNMSPEEMTQAMQASMQSFMNMDPQMRTRMMGNMMQAGVQMFQSMPADQRMQLLQGFGNFPGGPPARP